LETPTFLPEYDSLIPPKTDHRRLQRVCFYIFLFLPNLSSSPLFHLDVPLVTQSDPGSENYGIANAQTVLHHLHDPTLSGTIQHRWMHQKKNVMPEIA
jgi:hypothetical protein